MFDQLSLKNTLFKRVNLISPKTFKHVDIDLSKIGQLEQINEETGRTYKTPAGNVYPSITTVMGWNSAKHIAAWRQRIGDEAADKIMRQSARRGTHLHDICERYIDNQEILGENLLPYQKDNFLSIKSILDENIDNIHCQEKRLYSDYLGLAGTTDVIGDFVGKLSVIDFKTSQKIKKKEHIEHYFMQASAYAIMYEELTGIGVPQIVIIMKSDDGDKHVFIEKRNNFVPKLIEVTKQYKMHKELENEKSE